MINKIKQQDKLTDSMIREGDPENILPTAYCEVLFSPQRDRWLGAIRDKLKSMDEDKVFDTVDLWYALSIVPHENILSTKSVLVRKPEHYKAIIVTRGFKQIHGINYDKKFARTPKFNALWLLFSIVLLKQWPIRTFDVKVAFLHSLINKRVFFWCPQGINIPTLKVLALKKALYGTKQASWCWWLHLKEILSLIGFTSNNKDPSTYTLIKGTDKAILWIHVDNGEIVASLKELMEEITHELNKELKVKWDESISSLVAIRIKKLLQGYKFSQTYLIDKLSQINPSNVMSKSPLPMDCKLESNLESNMNKPNLKTIGMLLYIAQASRPDIAYAFNYLENFQ
ncbi:hypothetical protein O181_033737 [Austropuccinia psidii MF-1]|uniref:Reverse transcriptase Ty1/copia-type domain-containing protein n=1 Tax=Austropuccinia psidii MF-1 TaxID=1389203 RepID=A0A9Q3H7F6_9BASI|nr:hypothetical protein [Austropuccinia psidii MF-1]